MPDFRHKQQELAELLITLTMGGGGDPASALDLWRSLAAAQRSCGRTSPAGLDWGLSETDIEAGLSSALRATAARALRLEEHADRAREWRTETERRQQQQRRVSWASHDLRLSYPDEWAAALL